MLPKNTFRDRRLARLKITTGEVDPYASNGLKVYTGDVGEAAQGRV